MALAKPTCSGSRTARWKDRPLDLLYAKARRSTRHANIRPLHKLHAAGNGVAVDGGNNGFLGIEVPQQPARRDVWVREKALVPLVLRLAKTGHQRNELTQVRPCTKAIACAGDNADAHLIVVSD